MSAGSIYYVNQGFGLCDVELKLWVLLLTGDVKLRGMTRTVGDGSFMSLLKFED